MSVPGSTDPAHIRPNSELFDFALTAQETDRIAAMDRNKRFHNLPELVERLRADGCPLPERTWAWFSARKHA